MGQSTRIDWCDSSWNPVTGCLHGCEYCYARGIAKRFGSHGQGLIEDEDNPARTGNMFELESKGVLYPCMELDSPLLVKRGPKSKDSIAPYPFDFDPTFHRYKLDEPLHWKKPRTIFVCSMADLFGEWVPECWIFDVLDACLRAPQHRYLFLTKNPQRYIELAKKGLLPGGDGFWYGSTMPNPLTPYFYSDRVNTFGSIEPIQGDFGAWNVSKSTELPKWIIVGAETGNRRGKTIPKRRWIEGIVTNAENHGIPVFMKESLRSLMGADFRQEFPWGSGGCSSNYCEL